MPPVAALSPIPPTDPSGAASPPAPSSSESPLAAQMDAFSSEAGVTVRLLASLPANLGQNLDAAV